MPNADFSFSVERTEFLGRFAGVGYSEVGIGISFVFWDKEEASRIAWANPNQLVFPPHTRLYRPEACSKRERSPGELCGRT
jgi:hypothetical protein